MILHIHTLLKDRIRSALERLYGIEPTELPDVQIQVPPTRSMGDLGTPVAFELARTLRKGPKLIANELVEALGQINEVTRAEAAANGYVNLFLNRGLFFKSMATLDKHQHSDHKKPKTIVEHTAINPNKAAHVGHLRNTALGDTLVRVLRFLGTPVEVQNYIDDTGVQVADVVVAFEQLEHASVSDVKALADAPKFDHYCWRLYSRITQWYGNDKERLSFRERALHNLETGNNPTADMGQIISNQIVKCHLSTMARLNVEYDLLCWEGDILRLQFWSRAFEILKATDAIYFQTSGPQSGCWVMPLANQENDQQSSSGTVSNEANAGLNTQTKIIVRSNGTVTYVGKDIAYQFWKFGLLDLDFNYRFFSDQNSGHQLWSTTTETSSNTPTTTNSAFGHSSVVYNVIDTRQSYLQQLLKQALRAIGHESHAECSVHVSYEMVALSRSTAIALGHEIDAENNRPFVEVSGRKGLGVKADDLLDRVTTAARREIISRHEDLSNKERQLEVDRIANIIAVAAIRYFMIKYSRGKLIAFDIKEALSFEGESGPYLQYAAVRATNILRKLKERDGIDTATLTKTVAALPTEPLNDSDGTQIWTLVLEASRLDEISQQAARTLELSILAKYSFGLAQSFNTFYHQCPVVAEERRDVRLWRAAAVYYFLSQLTLALNLMGCDVPPRM